jgi:hypothetical protein
MWRFLGGAFAVLFLVLAFGSTGDASEIGIGVNYNWWKLDLTSLEECKAQGKSRSVGTWILPAYRNPDVRQVVNDQLRTMRRAGFSTMRVLVYYKHVSWSDPTSFTSMDGNLSSVEESELHDFVGDIAAAGFSTLEISVDFGGENWLFCRKGDWGDCFDATRTDENWRFISQVAQTALAAAGAMAIRFDLGNEHAPAPTMPARTLKQAKTYLQTIAGRFAARFGDAWLVSAGAPSDAPATQATQRLDIVIADLAEIGLVSRYLELHQYSDDVAGVDSSLDAVQSLAQKTHAQVVLGELPYHNAAQSAAISDWLGGHPDSRIVDLIQWPEFDPSKICAVNPNPPYTPGPLGAIH